MNLGLSKLPPLSIPQEQAVVDVLWDKYTLPLVVISLAYLVIDMASRCIYTYDVGLCHCSFLGMRAVEGLDRRERASTATRVFFCLNLMLNLG